ncbi:MAG TPA: NADH:flavin oxidoreductase/NADH oxidase [Xanthobacteraceae bacterium]|jgi:2,4-dienoyl-CoA reductase-like NADH-dependent reductase (Old Yellow Enzyme family)|nr:NADH:flavin oxidoreductase/NADH oxidase [Xanthobacteraceae bacterium]
MTSALFSPIRLAGLDLANRIVVAPMCQYSADDGVGNDWHMTHLGMLANSGAGMLVIEATHVERRGRITHGCLGLYSDACEAALERIVYHCRHIGSAKLAIQLAHAGRKASAQRPWEGAKALTPAEDAWPTIAPTALPFGPGWHTPTAMTEDDMARVTMAFVDAAKRAVRVGFDAVELHLAHGYLLHSFVSPLSNKRNDAWGGSLEGRMRFPLDVAKAVRAVMPREMPLGARITGSDWLDGGLTAADAVTLAKALKAAGLDYVDVSSGNITVDSRAPTDPGYNVPLAEPVRRETGIATRVVGMIAGAKQAEDIVASGKADMVAMARAFLDDPHWGWHAAQALGAEVARPPQYARTAPKLWPGTALRG